MSKKEEKVNDIIEIYVAPLKKYSFSVKVLDEKGKPIPVIDSVTNQHVRILGKPQYIEKTYRFGNIIDNVQKGCLSQFIVKKDTPEEVKQALSELCADRSSSVMTRDEWIKEHNPSQWAEIQRRKELEKEMQTRIKESIDPLKEALQVKDATIADLMAKLENLEKKVK